MSKLFKLTGGYYNGKREITAKDFVDRAIGSSVDYHSGEIETIRSELDKTQEILGGLIEHLNLDVSSLNKVVNALYGLEEKDE